jgi:hypothetical protein
MMQGIMWIILGATIGLAALVSHHRRSAFEVKLSPPITYRSVTVQLPKGWKLTKNPDELSSTLMTADESADSSDEDEESGGRTIRIVREPLGTYRTPLEFALTRLAPGGHRAGEHLPIAGLPGELQVQRRDMTPKSLQQILAHGGLVPAKTLCIATVGNSGRGLAVELEGTGEPESHDIDLIKRIAATIKIADEPPLTEAPEIVLGNDVHVPVPDLFATVKQDDPLLTARLMRTKSASGVMRSIMVAPMVMLPKDTRETVHSAVALFDYNFEDADVRQEEGGAWRADIDATAREVLPMRAFVLGKNGAGVIAVFRGGEDDAWIDDAWRAMREKLVFPQETDVSDLLASGATEAKRVAETGLKKLLPETNDEQWWLVCIQSADHPMGWRKLTPGGTTWNLQQRVQFERQMQETMLKWKGAMDLKSYSASQKFDVTDLREETPEARIPRGVTVALSNGKIDLTPLPAKNPISFTAPTDFIPGAWLPLILPKLSDHPMIVRTDSSIEYAHVKNTDLLTVTVRPEPDVKRTADDGATPVKCVSLEFSGSGEKMRFFFRPDGTLESADSPQSIRLLHSDEREINTSFSRIDAMKPGR